MKAAILVKSRKPLVLGDLELPKNLTYGQVKVKVFYSGICGAQINEIDAVKGKDKFLPHLIRTRRIWNCRRKLEMASRM